MTTQVEAQMTGNVWKIEKSVDEAVEVGKKKITENMSGRGRPGRTIVFEVAEEVCMDILEVRATITAYYHMGDDGKTTILLDT